ncbi:hypothetical protein ACFTXM_08515 [Streptomyces sp. NPDC056930]|uniref:hypothetical protein n=1 Tax=Streptomyces sp. NPDC056930 TaxID=3345967 RepID=UPI00363C41B6
MTTTATVLPSEEQVHALAAFVTDRVQESVTALKRRVPDLATEPVSPDAGEVLRIPEALISVTDHFAPLYADALDGPAADPTAAHATWRSLVSIAVTWIDHPQMPVDLREALTTVRHAPADA